MMDGGEDKGAGRVSTEAGAGAADVDEASGAQSPDPDAAPRAGRLTNLICGAVVSLAGAGALTVALDLGFGSLSEPGAGTWPAIVSLMLIAIGLLIMVEAANYTDAEQITKDGIGVAVGVVSLVVAVQLMPLIGFELPSFALLVFWMSVLGQEKLRLSVPISALVVVVLYFTFVYGLAVPVPRLFF